MSMMPLPNSWRDLNAEELRQLLEYRAPRFTIAELIFAQWLVACTKDAAARMAEIEADDAYFNAWQASIENHTSKALLAKEEAEKRRDRCRARVKRTEREKERLYAACRAAQEAA